MLFQSHLQPHLYSISVKEYLFKIPGIEPAIQIRAPKEKTFDSMLLLLLLLLLLLSCFSHVRLCATPQTAAHQAPPSLGCSRQEHWGGLPFPSPTHESEKWKWSRSVVSDSQRPHGLQPTRLLHPGDFPSESTGVGCHCLLQDSMLLLQLEEASPEGKVYCFVITSIVKWQAVQTSYIPNIYL